MKKNRRLLGISMMIEVGVSVWNIIIGIKSLERHMSGANGVSLSMSFLSFHGAMSAIWTAARLQQVRRGTGHDETEFRAMLFAKLGLDFIKTVSITYFMDQIGFFDPIKGRISEWRKRDKE